MYKQTKQTLEKLQKLVSADGRFRNLRDALHRCDPPCIPYLGLYLTDLSFIEEGTPTFTEDNLINFSKMRMVNILHEAVLGMRTTKYTLRIHDWILYSKHRFVFQQINRGIYWNKKLIKTLI
jgi:hypothetical protein